MTGIVLNCNRTLHLSMARVLQAERQVMPTRRFSNLEDKALGGLCEAAALSYLLVTPSSRTRGKPLCVTFWYHCNL